MMKAAAVLLVLLVAGCSKPSPDPERPNPPGYLPAYPPRDQVTSWDCWRH